MTSRLDGPDKVTGRAKYSLDYAFPDTAYGYVVLSTIARGEIEAMDTAAASKAPGVLKVFTPFNTFSLNEPFNSALGDLTTVPLQSRNVTYHGQPIGFVVADTFEQARDASQLVRVSYRERISRTSLIDELASAYEPAVVNGGTDYTITTLQDGVSSIDDVLAASPVVVDATYATAAQNHVAMEPHSAVARWNRDGLTVYTGSQGSCITAAELASAFDEDPARVRVVSSFVGGAFGGKVRVSVPALLAAGAAKVLKRTVKAALTREQVFSATANRPATRQRITLAAGRDGGLTALRHDSWCEAPVGSEYVEPTGYTTSALWYSTPNVSVSHKIVPLNIPQTTTMRGPGETPGSFALESAMDELAIALDMDPVQVRIKNISTGPPTKDLQWSANHLDECLRVGAERFGWSRREPKGRLDGDWLIGHGMAVAGYPSYRLPASVEVTLRADDSVIVTTSGADPGTGLLTTLALVAAESLDIPVQQVSAKLGDSRFPSGGVSAGSSATASAGTATTVATAQVVEDLIALATGPGGPFEGADVSYATGRVLTRSTSMSFGEVLSVLGLPTIAAIGSSAAGEEMTKHSFSSFGAHFCEVRVHRWTREARVTRLLGAFDAGRIINEKLARSQLQGGMIWGISTALHEGLEIDSNGWTVNGDLASYLIPVNADINDIEVQFVQHPDVLHNPLGAKGIGEIGTVGVAAAVANAIYNATGTRVRHVPITIEDLLDD